MSQTSKYSLKERLNFEEIYQRFLGLDPKQRILAMGGGIFLILLILLIPISLATSKISEQEEAILNHEKNMTSLISKINDYKLASRKLDALKEHWSKRSAVGLPTILEDISREVGVTIDSINPTVNTSTKSLLEEHVASVKLSRITLNQALDYLYKVESSPQGELKVSKLKMNPRFDNRQLFDLTFDVSTYYLAKSKEGGGK